MLLFHFIIFLERCYQSRNQNLINDLEKHGIPNRLKTISQLVTCSHWHSWVPIAKDRGAFTLERCVKEESEWNCASEKATIMSSECILDQGMIRRTVFHSIPQTRIGMQTTTYKQQFCGLCGLSATLLSYSV